MKKNIIKSINNTTMKVAKGMIAIFAIKLILFSAFLTFNACSTEESENSTNDNVAFKNALQNSYLSTNNIHVSNHSISSFSRSSELNEDFTTIYLLNNSGNSFDNTDFLNSINNIHDLSEATNQYELTVTEAIEVNENPIGTLNVPNQPAIDALQISIQEAKNVLYSKGYSDQDINEMLLEEGASEEHLVPVVMTLTSLDEQDDATLAFHNSLNLFFNAAYAQENTEDQHAVDWGKVGKCALAAIGADFVLSLSVEAGGKHDRWKRKALVKLIGKTASRMLGPVGVIIAVGTFVGCMYGVDF
jgi:hypothetical protein